MAPAAASPVTRAQRLSGALRGEDRQPSGLTDSAGVDRAYVGRGEVLELSFPLVLRADSDMAPTPRPHERSRSRIIARRIVSTAS
jgi:hypothetical protein